MSVKPYRLSTEKLMPFIQEITNDCLDTYIHHMGELSHSKDLKLGTSMSTISNSVAVSFFTTLIKMDMDGEYDEKKIEDIFNDVRKALKVKR